MRKFDTRVSTSLVSPAWLLHPNVHGAFVIAGSEQKTVGREAHGHDDPSARRFRKWLICSGHKKKSRRRQSRGTRAFMHVIDSRESHVDGRKIAMLREPAFD